MKKAFYILFTFYFISLAAMPCGDKDDCNEVKHEQTTQNTGDHEDEACTPFCICSCCATHFVTTSIESQVALVSTEVQQYPDPITSKVIGVILPIWQPPKLA